MSYETLMLDPFGEATKTQGNGYAMNSREVKDKVENIMETHPETRNSDTLLMLRLWESYDAIKINVTDQKAKELTKPSTISRVRREIQNEEGRFLPTLPGVLVRRRIEEEKIRRFYSDMKNLKVWKKYKEYTYEIK